MKITMTYFKNILKNPVLYISVLCSTAIALWGVISAGNFTSVDAWARYTEFAGISSLFGNMIDYSTYRKLILIVACMPFTARFCTELKSGFSMSVILRNSKESYILTHAVLNFLSTFLVSFLGMVLCTVILSCFFPLIGDVRNEYFGTFNQFMNNENTAWLFILLKSFFFSISLGAWSVSGAAISAIFPDPFIAICTPLIMSYILELVTIETDFLPDLWNLSRGYGCTSDDILFASLEIVLVFTALAVLFGVTFYYIAERRLKE